MTHYAIVHIIPKDADVLAAYRKVGLPAVQKHGGDKFAGGPGTSILEDAGAGSAEYLILSFPTEIAAKNWMNDPELQELHALRNKGADSTIILLPGF